MVYMLVYICTYMIYKHTHVHTFVNNRQYTTTCISKEEEEKKKNLHSLCTSM